MRDLDMRGIKVRKYQHNSILTIMEIQPTLINKIKEAQKGDQQIEAIFKTIRKGKKIDFHIKEDGVLWYKNRLCVPDIKKLKKEIFQKLIQLRIPHI